MRAPTSAFSHLRSFFLAELSRSLMRTRIKFCGLVRPGDVDDAVALGVDAVGLVFYERSPRALSIDEARALRRRLPSWVMAVGLFVNEAESAVAACAQQVGLDVIQFHGDETPASCLASAQGKPWWRAVRMRARGDLLESADAFSGAEALLVDSFSAAYGGSGERFDWSWIPARRSLPLVLSGGLDADSVAEGIQQVRPFAVDVSSGIQGSTAREKSITHMEAFVAAVLQADNALAQPLARTSMVPSTQA